MAMPESTASTVSPGVLTFGCPACGGQLTIPSHLAGVHGPCPLCSQEIAAPDPASNTAALVLGQASAPHHAPPPQAPPPPEPPPPPPAAPETSPSEHQRPPGTRRIHCGACQATLDVDLSLKVEGGPCPVCQTWIDLQGRSLPAEPSPEPPREPVHPPIPRPLSPDSSRGPVSPDLEVTVPVAINRERTPSQQEPPPPAQEERPRDEPQMERRVVRKRKKRRILPAECYVGQAAGHLDAKGQASAERMRSEPFPKAAKSEESRGPADPGESALSRWLPILAGILIPLAGGVFAAIKMDLLDPKLLRFWGNSTAAGSNANTSQLQSDIRSTAATLQGKQYDAWYKFEDTINKFLDSTKWEDAAQHLSTKLVPENSEALSFLKLFPREEFQGAKIEPLRGFNARIPKTERFVFTVKATKPGGTPADAPSTFFIVEEDESGETKIHALQLYQTWKESLTEFLETPGTQPGRFYVAVQQADSSSASPINLPSDGEFLPLKIGDLLLAKGEPWTAQAYVRKDSWAATRLLTDINTSKWSYAVVDLEWMQGPTGDNFILVKDLISSNWGDFQK